MAELAGDAAEGLICSQAGIPVVLHEMRPVRATEAHKTAALAELVCSNSFRSDDWEYNAVGLLHQEMRRLGFAGRIVSFEPLAQPFARLMQAAQGDPLWQVHRDPRPVF